MLCTEVLPDLNVHMEFLVSINALRTPEGSSISRSGNKKLASLRFICELHMLLETLDLKYNSWSRHIGYILGLLNKTEITSAQCLKSRFWSWYWLVFRSTSIGWSELSSEPHLKCQPIYIGCLIQPRRPYKKSFIYELFPSSEIFFHSFTFNVRISLMLQLKQPKIFTMLFLTKHISCLPTWNII